MTCQTLARQTGHLRRFAGNGRARRAPAHVAAGHGQVRVLGSSQHRMHWFGLGDFGRRRWFHFRCRRRDRTTRRRTPHRRGRDRNLGCWALAPPPASSSFARSVGSDEHTQTSDDRPKPGFGGDGMYMYDTRARVDRGYHVHIRYAIRRAALRRETGSAPAAAAPSLLLALAEAG